MAAARFIGLTGAIAAGKSEALAALERLGAATLSSDAVVHDLLDQRAGPRPAGRALGRRRGPGRGGRPREGRGDRVRATPRSSNGSRRRFTRWSARRSPPGGRVAARRHRGRRGRGAAAVRGRHGGRLRRDDRGRRRPTDSRASAPERAGRSTWRAGRRRQLSQEEKAARATHVIVNDGSVRGPRGGARRAARGAGSRAKGSRRRAALRRRMPRPDAGDRRRPRGRGRR